MSASRLFPTLSAVLGFLFAGAASAATGVISDLDDTVQLTGSRHPLRSIQAKLSFDTKVFPGMAELYRQLIGASGGDPADDLYFVSGGPGIFKPEMRHVLRANGFIFRDLMVRAFAPFPSTLKHKQKKFTQILETHPKQSYYFFGDDTERDPEALADIAMRFPERIAGLYVHQVEGAVPTLVEQGEIPYFTAAEVALHELKKGTITEGQALAVVTAILADPRFDETVIPEFGKLCPAENWLTNLVSTLGLTLSAGISESLAELEVRVEPLCTGKTRQPNAR